MADNSMAFTDWIARQGGEDFLRSLVETVLSRLMDYEASGIAGAGLHERSGERQTYRNGYRERRFDTRLDTLVRQVFVQPDATSAHRTWRRVADPIRSQSPKAAALMDEAEEDVLASFGFPAPHRVKLHSTHTLERLNKEGKRRVNVVGIFPNEASIRRLIGAVLMEQNEDWQLQHRYLPQLSMTDIPGASTEVGSLPAAA